MHSHYAVSFRTLVHGIQVFASTVQYPIDRGGRHNLLTFIAPGGVRKKGIIVNIIGFLN